MRLVLLLGISFAMTLAAGCAGQASNPDGTALAATDDVEKQPSRLRRMFTAKPVERSVRYRNRGAYGGYHGRQGSVNGNQGSGYPPRPARYVPRPGGQPCPSCGSYSPNGSVP